MCVGGGGKALMMRVRMLAFSCRWEIGIVVIKLQNIFYSYHIRELLCTNVNNGVHFSTFLYSKHMIYNLTLLFKLYR